MRTFWCLAIAGLMSLLAAAPALAARLTVTGDVVYRERLLMPAGAVLTVSLVDLAAPTVDIVSARAVTGDRGTVPFRFTLNFEDGLLRADRSYGLRAEIESADGKYWFRTPSPTAIDAASIAAPIVLMTAFQGPKPSPVDAFSKFFDAELQAASIAGGKVVTGHPPVFRIAADMRASGNGGCNDWFAQAELVGTSLAFSPVAATRMACVDATLGAQESAFFTALGAVRFWSETALGIDLEDKDGKRLVELVRITLN